MEVTNAEDLNDSKKSIGGKIPETLFWLFKETYTKRRESATEALEHAIRLYIDITKQENLEDETNGE